MASKLYSVTKEEFQEICLKFESIADVLRYFNMHPGAGNYKTFARRVACDNIDISHFLGQAYNKGKTGNNYKGNKGVDIESVLTDQDTGYKGGTKGIKAKVLKHKLIKNVCAICGQLPEWNNNPLVLRLDHINGINTDNRKENLRLICPNCDSQLPTFSGRNNKQALVG